ncbi:hypothetical protein HDV02_001418 [Globomyces sp. JEL0801]|nr:hypothetical protein HDV02_001418 [Globomyces sp. JEL0801]
MLSEASAKVGNFPFTTIKPNHGVAYVNMDCPCATFNKQSECNPRQGRCVQGKRAIPISIMDVAGLVPGASKGEGLGNQFLDDLRHATALIHVVDVSGTTDSGGKVTVGYDPINDIDWLRFEIHSWIYHNLMKRWDSIVRRHIATKSPIVDTLHTQFSGYGTTRLLMNQTLDKFPNKMPLETWDEDTIKELVNIFLDVRFPTIIALNKIDLPDSDKNIDRIFRKYDQSKIVLISALAENFLRKLHKQKFIQYHDGTEFFDTADDDVTLPDGSKLLPMDEKLKGRLEKVQGLDLFQLIFILDLVLFRYGHTGVQECLQTAVSVLGNVTNFSSSTGVRQGGVFRDCMFIRPGTTVRSLAGMVHPDLEKYYLYAETVGNIQLAEDTLVSPKNNIITFKTSQSINPKANK